MTKKNSTLWNVWNIVVAVIFVVLGVLTCAYAGNADFQNTVILIVGIFLLVIAGLQIFAQILRIIVAGSEVTMSTDFSIAGVTASELALGIVAIIVSQNPGRATVVFKYLGYFLGIFLVTIGAIVVIYEIVFLVKKMHSAGMAILTMILAALPIALGIVVMVFLNDQEHFLAFFFVCLGILFILLGVLYFAYAIMKIRAGIAAKKGQKPVVTKEEKEPEVVEAEAIESPKEEEPEEKPEEPSEEKPE